MYNEKIANMSPSSLGCRNIALSKIIIAMLIFGSIGLFRRYIPVSSGLLAFSRGLLGAVFLLCFYKLRGGVFFNSLDRKSGLWFCISGALLGINWMLLFEAYNNTTVAIATLCYYMQPTIVILLSSFFFQEELTKKKLILAGIAVLGMLFISGIFEGAAIFDANLKGIVWALSASCLYAAVVIMNKKAALSARAHDQTIVQLVASAVVLIPYLLLTENFTTLSINAGSLLLIGVLGIVHTGIAYMLFFGSMDELPAQTIAMLSYIEPLMALLLSALVLHELLTPFGILGAILILGTTFLAEKGDKVIT